MGATAKTIAGRFGWIISLSQLGDPGQVLRSFRLRFELIQFSSKTRSFPSVGVTAIARLESSAVGQKTDKHLEVPFQLEP